MRETQIKLKIVLILFTITLIGCNSTKIKNDQSAIDLLIGTWIVEKSTFNGQGSPVPKGTNLKFTSDNRVKVTLPNFGENYEDISGMGSWKKNDGIVTIEYDEKQLWGETQLWRIKKLTKNTLEWEMKMDDGLQEEIYTRE
jgi:hypothetical protein